MKIFRVILFLIVLLIVLMVFLTFYVHPFLSIDKPIQSKNLVIEAWLSGHELEQIIKKSNHFSLEKIFVVGKRFEDDRKLNPKLSDFEADEYFKWHKNREHGVLLLTNSSLLLDLSKLGLKLNDSINTISLYMSDTQKNNIFAHFNLSLNGKWLGSSFVNDSLKKYSFEIIVKSTGNDLLSIYFDNDYYSDNESRNLYIHSILVNDINYELNESNSLITRHESLLTTGFKSEASQTARYIHDLKVNSGITEIVEFEKNGYNQTLASAEKLKQYFNDSLPIDLNVSSAGLHARRTLFTYQKILEIDHVGVYNVPLRSFEQDNWYKSFPGIQRMLDEFVSYIYIWFYLNFV